MSAWRKSSHSGGDEASSCVEVAGLVNQGAPVVGIRDSKDPQGPKLLITPDEWTDLLRAIKHGPSEGLG